MIATATSARVMVADRENSRATAATTSHSALQRRRTVRSANCRAKTIRPTAATKASRAELPTMPWIRPPSNTSNNSLRDQ
jgi:hypothetical protein